MSSNFENTKKPKVCFVAPYCYPLFNPQHRTMFGGWEVRISQITKELAKRGNYRVSIIVADYNQPHIENREGVELISWQGKTISGIHTLTEYKYIKKKPITNPSNSANNRGRQDQIDIPTTPVNSSVNEVKTEANLYRRTIQAFIRTKTTIKKFYKRIIPWRIRIVIKSVLLGLINGFKVFMDNTLLAMKIAKHAIGNMGDVPVFSETISIFQEADADIYVVPGNNNLSAEVAWFSRKFKRIFIMLAGSDIDFSPEIKTNPENQDIYEVPYQLKLFAINNADAHIVQNEKQKEMAKAFGCSPELILNPVNLDLIYSKAKNPNVILWVGNSVESVKRPSIMLEAIQKLPSYEFIMIITPVVQEAYDQLIRASQSLPNLRVLSRVPFEEIEQYFAQAKLFVNTSTFEGFPNTFLQAGKYGVPIVSMKVDPNEMLSQHGCGLICHDNISILVENIKKMMTDEDQYRQACENILRYLRQYHDKDKIIPQYEMVFQSLLREKLYTKDPAIQNVASVI